MDIKTLEDIIEALKTRIKEEVAFAEDLVASNSTSPFHQPDDLRDILELAVEEVQSLLEHARRERAPDRSAHHG